MILRWESRAVSVVSPGTDHEQRADRRLGRHRTRAAAERRAYRFISFDRHGWGYALDRETGEQVTPFPPGVLR